MINILKAMLLGTNNFVLLLILSRKVGKLAFFLLRDLMQTRLTYQLILNVFIVFLSVNIG